VKLDRVVVRALGGRARHPWRLMTKKSDFKALVRARMQKTGERYAAARAAIATEVSAPRVPDAVLKAAQSLLDAVDEAQPDLVAGFHLVGSVAYGDYKAGKSDVDFVAVLDRELDESDVDILRQAHKSMSTRPPLDGIYTTRQQLRDGTTPDARFHDGVLVARDDYGATPVTRRELATIGIPIRGSIDELDIENDTVVLQRWVRENLDTYWTDWVRRASGWTPLAIYALLPRGAEWSVLGITRMLYTLETGLLVSKSAAAAWAIERVDDSHHEVLRSVERIRNGNAGNFLPMAERRAQALAYMSHVLATAPQSPAAEAE
jgi:hypothetical protein